MPVVTHTSIVLQTINIFIESITQHLYITVTSVGSNKTLDRHHGDQPGLLRKTFFFYFQTKRNYQNTCFICLDTGIIPYHCWCYNLHKIRIITKYSWKQL